MFTKNGDLVAYTTSHVFVCVFLTPSGALIHRSPISNPVGHSLILININMKTLVKIRPKREGLLCVVHDGDIGS